jgi:hypothetical protein
MNAYDGRGWEPERTWHTPRRDSSSVKGPSGRWLPQSEVAKPDWYGSPGVLSSRAGGELLPEARSDHETSARATAPP